MHPASLCRSFRTSRAARRLQLALAASALLAHLGCLSTSGPRQIATLKYIIELHSTSGAPADTPIYLDTMYSNEESKRGVRPDSEGRLEFTERRLPDPSNPFVLRAPIERWKQVRIHLPEVHPTMGYSISFVLDRSHSMWNEIEQGAVLTPPLRVEPGQAPDGGAFLHRHGATYFDNSGQYSSTVVLANGTDVRRVPLGTRPRVGAVPGEPRLEVRALATPLVAERGYQLHIRLTVPNPSDRSAELSAVLRPLRAHLDRVAAGHADDDHDLKLLDIGWLVGASPDEVFEGLGEPDGCLPVQGPGSRGVTLAAFPCELGREDIVYRFYPQGSPDGGMELRLSFRHDGRCTSARWEFIR